MSRNPARVLAFALIALAAFASHALAQELDCKDPQDQASMTQCAYLAWEAADKDLNTEWKKAISDAKDADTELHSYGDDGRPGHVETLRKAQRAWLEFRDAQCEYEGFEARGGTMEPMIVGFCLEQLTLERTKQLKNELSEQ